MRATHARTGIAAADFSRIRNADLGRFTADRLIAVLNRLGVRVECESPGASCQKRRLKCSFVGTAC